MLTGHESFANLSTILLDRFFFSSSERHESVYGSLRYSWRLQCYLVNLVGGDGGAVGKMGGIRDIIG